MLKEADYEWAAKELNCDVPAIKAVAKVESGGEGFLKTGEPKILFEAHIFSRLTNNRFDASNPALSSVRWNRRLYAGSGLGEHKRLASASELDRTAALKSASWGRFQIMGFNWALTGYASLQDFINGMYAGELGQLKGFIGFLKKGGLDKHLREHNWREFARRYNGAAYEENNYHIKLADAFRQFQN